MARLETYIITAIALAAGVAVTIIQWLHPDTRKWLLRSALSVCIAVVFVGVICILEIEGGQVISGKQIFPMGLIILCVIGGVLGAYWFVSVKPQGPKVTESPKALREPPSQTEKSKVAQIPKPERQNIDTRSTDRPYFEISEPGIKPLPHSPPYRVMIQMHNTGNHAARDLTGSIVMVDQGFKDKPIILSFSVGNDVPPKQPAPFYNDSLFLPPEQPAMYIVYKISYRDALSTSNEYHQVWYMKWDGVQGGRTSPDFVHTSVSERDLIKARLSEEIKDITK